jgi:hypothetical protein
MPSLRKTSLAVLLPVFLQACAWQMEKVNALDGHLEQSTPEAVLLSLESIDPPQRDLGQYLLNRGLLKSISGDFEDANRDLQSAKEILNSLQATSVSETLGAAMVNETLRSGRIDEATCRGGRACRPACQCPFCCRPGL